MRSSAVYPFPSSRTCRWLMAAAFCALGACSGSSGSATATTTNAAAVTATSAASSSGSSASSTLSSGGSTGLPTCMGQACQTSDQCCSGAYCFQGLCYENGVNPTTSTGGSGSSGQSLSAGSASSGMTSSTTGNTSSTSNAGNTSSTSNASSASASSASSTSGSTRTSSTGKGSGSTGGTFSLGAAKRVHFPNEAAIGLVIVMPPAGSAAAGHAFVPGVTLKGGMQGYVHDINLSAASDASTNFLTNGPFGGAYVNDQLSVCDTGANGWDSAYATYSNGTLGATQSAPFQMCLNEVAVPGTNYVATVPVGEVGKTGAVLLDFLDETNSYSSVRTAVDSTGVAPAVLPSWISASQTAVATIGPGGNEIPDAGGSLLTTDVATGDINRIVTYDGGLFTAVAISPDATQVYASWLVAAETNSNENNPPPSYLQSFDVSTRTRLKNVKLDGYVFQLAISPDGKALVALMSNDSENTGATPWVEAIDPTTLVKTQTQPLVENESPLSLAFSPDYKWLLVTETYHFMIFPVHH